MEGKPSGGEDTRTRETGSLDNINKQIKNQHTHYKKKKNLLANCIIKETWRS